MIKIYIVITFLLISLGCYSQIKEFVPLKGYKGSIELGFAAGAGETAHNRGEFLIVNGYQFNNWLSAGIGTGIQLWQLSNRVTIPIFADVEATFIKKQLLPLQVYVWVIISTLNMKIFYQKKKSILVQHSASVGEFQNITL